ncbi:uncharacterized protein [Watersipora subatra]|uniref:uncharacterized protein n=1 Tax=Watersipora subatra TaxID=2589382 RepID=UPI00355C5A84
MLSVGLTSIPAKCLERLVSHITSLLTDESQFAYKPNQSTEYALILPIVLLYHIIDVVSEHLNKNANNFVRVLFIDYTSAFNTINPPMSMKKMVSQPGIHSNIINSLYNFLTNQTQTVKTSANTSDLIKDLIRTPQGCIISLWMFSFYVSDMSCQHDNMKYIKYAVKTVVLEFLTATQTSNLQDEGDNLSNCCADNDLLLNSNKNKRINLH